MYNFRKFVSLLLAVAMLFALAGCTGKTAANAEDTETRPLQSSSPAYEKSDYEIDAGRYFAVTKVIEKSEGYSGVGTGVLKGTDEWLGLPCQALKCETLYFYNEPGFKEAMSLAGGKNWIYNTLSGSEGRGGVVQVDNALRKQLRGTGDKLEIYEKIRLDWRYKDVVEVGDIILVDLGVQLWKNPNSGSAETAIHAVVNPLSAEGAAPNIAVFKDGKLQLSKELEGVFDLRRLYNDTDPELTGIRDGASVEEVVAFLEAVEQDIARYREENPECWVDVQRPDMIADGEDLICQSAIKAKGRKIEATLKLREYDGETIKTWTASGDDEIVFKETVPIDQNAYYNLEISGTVDGVPFASKCKSEFPGDTAH